MHREYRGAVLVAASDSTGAVHDPEGLDVAALIRLKDSGGSVCDYPTGRKLDRDGIIDVDCEVWIPAARPDVVNEDNVHRLKTKLVVQGANIPFTVGAERTLHDRGVLVVPDFIANAGGVICAAMEYHGAPEPSVFSVIEQKLRANTTAVLDISAREHITPRDAALRLATTRVRAAMAHRRWGIY